MTGGITMKNMPEFRRVMREYRDVSKRENSTIVYTKMFYIARGAVRNTHRPTKAQIREDLKQLFQGQQINKVMVMRHRMNALFTPHMAPLAALIINAARGRRGLPGLWGKKMEQAVNSFASRRYRAIAFVASGFLPAVKEFEPLAENRGKAPARDNAVKQFGQPKGSGLALGKGTLFPRAIITNTASGHGTETTQQERAASMGLALAFRQEISSMLEYIYRKKQETANKYSTRSH